MITIPKTFKKYLPDNRPYSPIEIAVDVQLHLQAGLPISDKHIVERWGLNPASKKDLKTITRLLNGLKIKRSDYGMPIPITKEIYLTKKRRILTGKRLESFLRFWEAFDYKTGKAEAADAWLDIPLLTDKLVSQIVTAARQEANRRPGLKKKGYTPKMAQGWLSARRWEDETYNRPDADNGADRSASGPRRLTRAEIMKLNQ